LKKNRRLAIYNSSPLPPIPFLPKEGPKPTQSCHSDPSAGRGRIYVIKGVDPSLPSLRSGLRVTKDVQGDISRSFKVTNVAATL